MIHHYRLSSQDENKAETPENGDSVSYMFCFGFFTLYYLHHDNVIIAIKCSWILMFVHWFIALENHYNFSNTNISNDLLAHLHVS